MKPTSMTFADIWTLLEKEERNALASYMGCPLAILALSSINRVKLIPSGCNCPACPTCNAFKKVIHILRCGGEHD